MSYRNVLEKDFEAIAQSNIEFEKLKNSNVLVTGATGFIGSLLIKSLLYCSELKDLNIKVIALVRNIVKAKDIFAQYSNSKNLEFVSCDLSRGEIEVDDKIDYIIHCASVTTSKIMIEKPTEVIQTAVLGTDNILRLAVRKNVKSVVYLSSMEVYGSLPNEKADETKLGYIDLTSARSCYPESKRMCECLCTAYFSQFGLNVKIARLAQTFGAGVLQSDNRVFAQFAKSVINKTDIVLHTTGESEGNYVYSSDAIIAILLILLKGKGGEAYNIANEQSHTTIFDMAKLVSESIANKEIKVVIDIPDNLADYGYAQTTKLFLDTEKIQKLGWKAQVSLTESYKRLVEYYKCIQ